MSLASLERSVQELSVQPSTAQINALIALANALPQLAPAADVHWTVKDVRQDIECDDTVGLYARLEGERVRLAAEVGQEVTTLTKALTALLVQHLDGESVDAIRRVSSSDLMPIVPQTLLRQRRNTVHYALQRVQDVVKTLEGAALAPSL